MDRQIIARTAGFAALVPHRAGDEEGGEAAPAAPASMWRRYWDRILAGHAAGRSAYGGDWRNSAAYMAEMARHNPELAAGLGGGAIGMLLGGRNRWKWAAGLGAAGLGGAYAWNRFGGADGIADRMGAWGARVADPTIARLQKMLSDVRVGLKDEDRELLQGFQRAIGPDGKVRLVHEMGWPGGGRAQSRQAAAPSTAEASAPNAAGTRDLTSRRLLTDMYDQGRSLVADIASSFNRG